MTTHRIAQHDPAVTDFVNRLIAPLTGVLRFRFEGDGLVVITTTDGHYEVFAGGWGCDWETAFIEAWAELIHHLLAVRPVATAAEQARHERKEEP